MTRTRTRNDSATFSDGYFQKIDVDVDGYFHGIDFKDATTGIVAIHAPTSVTDYSLILPATQASGTQFLQNDGSGQLSWTSSSVSTGNLTSTYTPVLTITGGTGAVVGSGTSITITKADSTHDGYLTSTDFTTFNNKQNALAIGNIASAYLPLSISGGTGAIIGSGVSVTLQVATTSQDGYLTSVNWNTFNSKEPAQTKGTISSSYGPLSISSGASSTVGPNVTLTLPQATVSQDGYIAQADFTIFNNKVATTRGISTTSPLTGGGDLSANRTIAIPKATGSVDGYLSATDFTTFNGKQSALSFPFDPNVGGTGIANNSASTLTISGAHPLTFTISSVTNITLPTSGTLVTATSSDALTNKILSGNTATNLLSGLAVITLPTTSGTLATLANGETLTNKTIGSSNNITDATASSFTNGGTVTLPTSGTLLANSRAINTTSPLAGGGDLSADRTIAIPKATTSVDGYLSSVDFTTFNNKQSTITIGNLTSAQAPLAVAGGTGAIIGAGVTLTLNKATTSVDGYLGASDFTTFNNKVSTTRSISTTTPITGGGDLSADRTIAIPKATGSVDGYLGSPDFTTFNNKVSGTRAINTSAPISGGGDLSADRTFSMAKATISVDGYLAATDFATFNNKQSALTFPLASNLGGTGVANNAASTFTISGNFATTLTVSNTTSVTLPTAGTLSTLAGTEAFTNKDYQGGTASNTSRLTIPNAALSTLTGLTRKQGTVVYNTDTNQLLSDDGTNLNPVSVGTGEKNYLATSSSTAIGWTGVGTVTVATDVTAADLPRANTTKTGWKFTPSGTSFTYTVTSATPAVFTASAHGMKTGYALTLSVTGGSLATGLSSTQTYYVNVLSSSTFNVSTTMANLIAGTYVATSSTGSGTQSGAYGLAQNRFTLDAADYNKKLKVQLDQNIPSGATGDWEVDIYSNTASDYSGTYTRLLLSTDTSGSSLLPNLEGTFKTAFDAPGSTAQYIELRIQRANANTHALVGSDLIVGPGTIQQGAGVSQWTIFTPTFSSQTAGTRTGKWRRVGDSMEIEATIVSPSAWGVYQDLTMPTGYTIDTSSLTTGTTVVGSAITRVSNSSFVYPGVVVASTSTTLRPGGGGSQTDFWAASITSPASYTANQGSTSIHAVVPILEWIGGSTVNVVQNDVEYVWNSDTTDATNSTSFGYGPTGVVVGSFSAGRNKTVQFVTPIQATDQISLEYSTNGLTWYPIHGADGSTGNIAPRTSQNGVGYGVSVEPSSSTQAIVAFSTYAWPSGVTFGAAGTAWSTAAGNSIRWRVKKSSAGQAVGFGAVTSTASGLIPASNTSLDDGSSTRLGFKQYLHGTTYSGGNAPTVTCGQAGFAIVRAVFVPYQMQDGAWRLRYNIVATFNSATVTALTLTVNGATFKNVSNYFQTTVAFYFGTGQNQQQSYANPNAATLTIQAASGTTTGVSTSGDVELDSKPTWAY